MSKVDNIIENYIKNNQEGTIDATKLNKEEFAELFQKMLIISENDNTITFTPLLI